MAAKQYKLEIITPRGIFYEGDASIITLKISEGYVGIMADRMPLMSSVKISRFTMKKDDNSTEKVGIIGNGIVKTDKDHVVIIVNDVLWSNEASKSEVQKSLNKAKERFEAIKEDGVRKQKAAQAVEFWELALKETK